MASETPVATASETAKIPATQKSWRAVRAGEPEKALALSDNTPVPSKLKKGEILVKVQAAALNPVYVHICVGEVLYALGDADWVCDGAAGTRYSGSCRASS